MEKDKETVVGEEGGLIEEEVVTVEGTVALVKDTRGEGATGGETREVETEEVEARGGGTAEVETTEGEATEDKTEEERRVSET